MHNHLIFKQVPTPGQGGARLVFDEKTSGDLVLYDQLGRAVRRMVVENETVAELYSLLPGSYIAVFRSGMRVSTTRVLVE